MAARRPAADSGHARSGIGRAVVLVLSAGLLLAPVARAEGLGTPLTASPGDPARGEAIVTDPQTGLCTLCHAGPFPQVAFTGTLAPDLTGVGARRTIPELRQQIVDSRVANPDTIMPPYHTTEGLHRVGERWLGATLLTAQEVEDVVAYLATLTEDAP